MFRRLSQYGLLFVFVPLLSGQRAPTAWQLRGARLQVASDTITYETKKSPPLSIAIATQAITSICYDTTAHARGPSAWEATKAMGGTQGGIILAPLVLPITAGVHASKSVRHVIVLHWGASKPGKDSVQTLIFEAQKENYAALLQEIQRVTGKPWTDVSQKRKDAYAKFGNELKSAEKDKHAPYLVIKERTRVGSSVLDPHSYHAVLRRRTSGEGDLYIVAGTKKERELMAVVRVSIKDEKNSDADAVPVVDSSPDSLPRVIAIKLPAQTLVVSTSQPYEYDPNCPCLP